MIVCVCKNISDRHIAREVAGGCGSFRELQARTGLGTGCGSCVDHAVDTFAAHQPQACGGAGGCSGLGRAAAQAVPAC